MGNGVTSQVQGLSELNRKIRLVKQAVDGPPLTKLLASSATPIKQQAQRNARKGPSGLVQRGVTILKGKKASKFGAAVLVKAKWKGTGAVFEEWGTQEHGSSVMRIPLGKFGAYAKVGNRGMKRAATVFTANSFGFGFFRKVKGMIGTRFFENAVEAKMPGAERAIEKGIPELITGAIR